MQLDRLSVRLTVFAIALVAIAGVLRLDAQTTALQVTRVAVVDGQITITGKNFGAQPTVTLAGAALTVGSVTDTEIVAGAPVLAAGVYPLVVSRDGGASADGTARTSVVIQ